MEKEVNIGDIILIQGHQVKVVGIFREDDYFSAQNDDIFLNITLSTYLQEINDSTKPNN